MCVTAICTDGFPQSTLSPSECDHCRAGPALQPPGPNADSRTRDSSHSRCCDQLRWGPDLSSGDTSLKWGDELYPESPDDQERRCLPTAP